MLLLTFVIHDVLLVEYHYCVIGFIFMALSLSCYWNQLFTAFHWLCRSIVFLVLCSWHCSSNIKQVPNLADVEQGFSEGKYKRRKEKDQLYVRGNNHCSAFDVNLMQSGTKCGVGSHCTCSHFFWLIVHILTIFDKKYRILTRRDKRESYSIFLQQNNVQVC